ncbi:MAG: ankyrin repeat domain-containing protein [Alphaproteobacteria bacterium]
MKEHALFNNLYTQLSKSINNNPIEIRKFLELLNSVNDINNITDGSMSLFYHMLSFPRIPLKLIEAAIDKGASIENFGKTRKDITPLAKAVSVGNLEAVKLLLSRGAEIDRRAENDERFTPLHWAIMGLKTEIVINLIENGADVNAIVVHMNKTCLMRALQLTKHAIFQHNEQDKSTVISIIEILVSNGAKLENEMIPLANKISPTLGKKLMSLSLNYQKKLASTAAKEIYSVMLDLIQTNLPQDHIVEIASNLKNGDRLHPKTLYTMLESANNFYNNRAKKTTYIEKLGNVVYNYVPSTLYNYSPSFIKKIVKEGPKTNLKAIMNEPVQHEHNLNYARNGRL